MYHRLVGPMCFWIPYLIYVLSITYIRTEPVPEPAHKRAPSQEHFTNILNNLLKGYDQRMRPGPEGMFGPPIKVLVDMYIRSMGPISEVDMTYSMDTYFRQTWVDKRLQFEGPPDKMLVQIKLLEKIWKPDTYFYNGHESYLHTITYPNKLLRLMNDGSILYSMRLTIKGKCPMYLHYFPMDEQACPLQFGSYAYTTNQLYYEWKHGPGDSIETDPNMKLSQFSLTGHPACNVTVMRNGGEYSTLKATFHLQRHAGYFLIQVYLPCSLIVILSWVSFWLNREATADRFTLGITSVLTLTTLSMDTCDDLPKVHYATALDTFVFMCYLFIIASLLEFAGVHYFTKIGSGELINRLRENDEDSNTDNEEDEKYITYLKKRHLANHHNNSTYYTNSSHSNKHKRQAHDIGKDGCLKKFMKCLEGNHLYQKAMKRRSQKSNFNSVSLIDKVSRILFPMSFIVLNVIYWIAYSR